MTSNFNQSSILPIFCRTSGAGSAPIGQAHVQRLLTTAQRAEVGHGPGQSDQLQKALYEPGGLPQRHAKQDLQGQAGLDRRIAELALAATFASWRRRPDHLRVKPDR